MARRPVEYISCARCGYRGTARNHECPDATATEATPVDARALPPPTPAFDAAPDEPGDFQAAKLARDISTMLDRFVGVDYVNDHGGVGSYDVHQQCAACRALLTATVRGDRTYFGTLAAVGRRTRAEVLKHRCAPVEASLAAIPTEDLRTLFEQLEADSIRLGERALAVQRVLDARLKD